MLPSRGSFARLLPLVPTGGTGCRQASVATTGFRDSVPALAATGFPRDGLGACTSRKARPGRVAHRACSLTWHGDPRRKLLRRPQPARLTQIARPLVLGRPGGPRHVVAPIMARAAGLAPCTPGWLPDGASARPLITASAEVAVRGRAARSHPSRAMVPMAGFPTMTRPGLNGGCAG